MEHSLGVAAAPEPAIPSARLTSQALRRVPEPYFLASGERLSGILDGNKGRKVLPNRPAWLARSMPAGVIHRKASGWDA